MNILKGKLSYTLAALAVVGAIAGALLGIIDNDTAVGVIWAGLALFGLRRAVTPVTPE